MTQASPGVSQRSARRHPERPGRDELRIRERHTLGELVVASRLSARHPASTMFHGREFGREPGSVSPGLFDEGELRPVWVDQKTCPKPPFLHANRMESWHPPRADWHMGGTNRLVQLVDVIDTQAAHEIARRRVQGRCWKKLQLHLTSGQDHPARVTKLSLKAKSGVERLGSVEIS